jgi:formylglycine-generating enzyme required for sulfatase activity
VDLGGGVLMMAYEASRPDASKTEEGSMTAKACSAVDRLPWTNITWVEANAACCALNADGQCANNQAGWRLCDASTWEEACTGGTGSRTCKWAYADSSSCVHADGVTTYNEVCMGAEAAADSNVQLTCSAGVSQCATYAGRFTDCYADWGNNNKLFDLSGNVREWTYDSTSQSDVHAIRGGGYSNFESARACAFDFNAGDATFHFPSTGFRCCMYP